MPQIHEKVRSLYEKYPYPTPQDCIQEVKNGFKLERSYPNLFFHNIWPYKKYTGKLDILIAGCGSMQSVEYATANPEANVIGVDLSQQSLDHSRMLADRHNITNLTLHKLEIENIYKLNKKFDLIVSIGVIHHLPNPEKGLTELQKVLNKDGSICLMLYGKYGRDAIYYIQELLSKLGFSIENLTEESLEYIDEILAVLPPYHPIYARKPLFNDLWNKDKRSEMLDYFLHPKDKAYSIPDIYQLLDNCGLKMQKLLDQAHYIPECNSLSKTSYFNHIKNLPLEKQYEIGELFNASLIKHAFITCSKDRKESTYKIDFNNPNWKKLIPILYYGLDKKKSFEQIELKSPYHIIDIKLNFDTISTKLFECIDNLRTIEEIERNLQFNHVDKDSYLKNFFKSLMDFDFIYFNAEHL